MKYILFVVLAFLFFLSGVDSGFETAVNPIRIMMFVVTSLGLLSIVIWGVVEKRGGNYKPWFWTSSILILLWVVLAFTTARF